MKYKQPLPLFVNAYSHPVEGGFSDLVGSRLDDNLVLKILATHKVSCSCDFCAEATKRLIKNNH